MKSALAQLFRPQLKKMSAYKVADASGFIKLDAMENPYTWSTELTQQWLETLRHSELNRYPDPEAKPLVNTLRKVYNIPESQGVILGNGSDEIIQLLLMALPSNASVLAPAPSFVMYQQIALSLGLQYHCVSLLANSFELDLAAMLVTINQHQPEIIFLAYPNNPTANLFNKADIQQIIEASQGLVVIDEAYAPFANSSYMDELGQHERLLVMRTVSKLGLAGLRLGYMAGNPCIIEQLNKIRLPYNINILTQLTADFALSNPAIFEQQTQKICTEREFLLTQLNGLKGITAYPSAANFILFHCQNSADAIFESLKQQGVLIKNTSPQGGLLSQCLRVTVGKPEENRAFMDALKNSLSSF